jgi:hypothetical protein
MNALLNPLASVRPGDPVTCQGLTMIPLLRSDVGAPGYLTLDEALADGRFHITEVSEEGRVPELLALNEGAQAILILDGEELVGAKQNRVANLTVLVPAHSRVHLPVSCVEAGRWHRRTACFKSAARAMYSEGRALKAAAVSRSYLSVRAPRSDQNAIWDDIAAKSTRLNARSSTGAMEAAYDVAEASLNEVRVALQPLPHQVGAVFYVEGSFAGCDLFDSSETWSKLAPKLAVSYGLDACDTGRTRRGAPLSPKELFEALRTARCDLFPAVGAGRDVRIQHTAIQGGALVVDEHLVHVGLFPAFAA